MFSASAMIAAVTVNAADTAGGANDGTLSSNQGTLLILVVIVGSLLAGAVVIIGRLGNEKTPDSDQSIIRGWIAMTLVFALLCFCSAAFLVNDTQLRSTLIGGLVASVGTAVAFYFSSKGADQARSDLLKTATVIAQGGAAPSTFSANQPNDAKVGVEYSYAFVADGTAPVAYKVAGGALPDGLTLDGDGRLHGTPTTPGEATFSVVATNAIGSHATNDIKLTVAT